MGWGRLLKRFRPSKEEHLPPKNKKSLEPFHEIFKRAFERSKVDPPTVVEVNAQPRAQPIRRDQAASEPAKPDVDVGCVKYSDTFMITDVPPNPLLVQEGSKRIGIRDDLSTASIEPLRSQPPEFPLYTFEVKPSKATNDPHHQGLAKCNARPASVSHVSSNEDIQSSHKRCKSLDTPASLAVLRRTQSQTCLVKHLEQPTTKPSVLASRRSSTSQPSHNRTCDHESRLLGTVLGEVENGMLKLHKRNACIKLILSQRRLDRALSPDSATASEESNFEHDQVPSDYGGVSDATGTCPSSICLSSRESQDSELNDVKFEPVEQKSIQSLEQDTATNDRIDALQARLALLESQKAEAEVRHEEEITSKDEQVQKIVSMYQALNAKHDELKAQVEHSATGLSKPGASQTLNPELKGFRHAMGVKVEEVANAMSSIDHLQRELENAKHDKHDKEALLFGAYHHIDGLTRQLATAQATEEEKDRMLLNAFNENRVADAKLVEAQKTVKDLEALAEKLKQLKIHSTSELVDMKSECERTLLQNMIMREAMEMNPTKAAEFDNTIGHLKNELAEADERRIEAEETNIELQKQMREDQTKSAAEKTALTKENAMLSLALTGMQSNKRNLEQAIDIYVTTIRGANMADSLEAAIKSYRSTLQLDRQIDTRLTKLVESHSDAVQTAKGLEIRCSQLETAAKDQDVKYADIESEYHRKSQEVDFMEMEVEAKKKDHENALTKKDADIATAKKEAAHFENLLDIFKHSNADTVTSWFFRRQEGEVEKTKTALKHSEGRLEALQQELRTKVGYEKLDKELRDWNECQARYDISPAARDEVEELKQKLEDLKSKLCAPDAIKWSDHLRRIEEVRAQTTAQLENESREQLEATVSREITLRFGLDYVKPMAELGSYLWARIWRLEQILVNGGYAVEDLDDNERHTLLRVSRDFEVLT